MNQMQKVTLTLLSLLLAAPAAAQRATEVYIPIGESPGVSDSESIIGTITDVDYSQHRMEVASAGETRTVNTTEETRYYLDRSAEGESSEAAGFNECREGRRIEAYIDDSGNAIWIKIATR